MAKVKHEQQNTILNFFSRKKSMKPTPSSFCSLSSETPSSSKMIPESSNNQNVETNALSTESNNRNVTESQSSSTSYATTTQETILGTPDTSDCLSGNTILQEKDARHFNTPLPYVDSNFLTKHTSRSPNTCGSICLSSSPASELIKSKGTPITPPTLMREMEDQIETPPSALSLSMLPTPCSPPTPSSRHYSQSDNYTDRREGTLKSICKYDPSLKVNLIRSSVEILEGGRKQQWSNTLPVNEGLLNEELKDKGRESSHCEKFAEQTKPSNCDLSDEYSLFPSMSLHTTETHKPSSKRPSKQCKLTGDNRPSKTAKVGQQTIKKNDQLYLDFGQADFGKRTICKICGMLRVHGLEEDDVQHAKICKQFSEGVAFMGWKSERSFGFGEDKIVEVRCDDPLQHKKKVMEVKAIVDAELGFSTPNSFSNHMSSTEQSDYNLSILKGITSFLYISKKRVVGLLLVKLITKAYASKCDQGSLSRSLKSSKAMMGVHQIWCHCSHRKHGIASKLCDTARSNCVFGMTIPLHLVAFSSPTLDGISFAKKYLGTENPLVYDLSCSKRRRRRRK